jgi:predicted SAM-dependent methyltransferase
LISLAVPGASTVRQRIKTLFAKRSSSSDRKRLPVSASGEHWFIDRWSHYRGSFCAQGWFFRTQAKVTSIQLCEKNSHAPISEKTMIRIRLASPDVEAAYGSSAHCCRFDITADIESVDRVLEVALKVNLDTGAIVYIDDPQARALSVDPYHELRRIFFDSIAGQVNPGKVVEIGARARSGNVIRNLLPPGVEYVGADIMTGPNVDVVCDAHNLSDYFDRNSVDAIFSVSVFEHLLMPWKVALEMNKVLKPGGLLLTMTHQSFPPHDQPWDFWRFTDQSWHGLFNKFTGFEVLKTAMGEPLEMVANIVTKVTKGFADAPGYAGSAAICRKVSETALSWPANLGDIISTAYPK